MLEQIGRLTNLEHLDIHQYSPEFTDAGFQHLAPLTRMKTFKCYAPEITDGALSAMDGWNQLESLHMNASKLTDAQLRWAAGRPALRELVNNYTHNFTDAGLDALGPDSSLRLLEIGGLFTREKIDALNARLPELSIKRSSGTQIQQADGTWTTGTGGRISHEGRIKQLDEAMRRSKQRMESESEAGE